MLVILFPLSLIALAVALMIPGYGDLVMLAGPMALASLILLWRGWLRSRRQARRGPRDRTPPRPVFRKAAGQSFVVIDGSNVMHWNGGVPALATVAEVIREMANRGMTPGVIFDANAGYKVGERYQDDRELSRRLGLPDDRVLVVPKGTPADKYILEAARGLKAKVVTNDRYRDWAEEFPEVAEPGFLLRGGIKDGVVWVV